MFVFVCLCVCVCICVCLCVCVCVCVCEFLFSGRAALPSAITDAKQRQGLSSEEEEILSVVETAISDEAGAASALALDRLRALAKAEWAVSKLHGRWPLPSGKVLPSTAPVGNDRISLCLRALAMLREGKPVRVTSLMGVKAPCRHLISKKDSAEDR